LSPLSGTWPSLSTRSQVTVKQAITANGPAALVVGRASYCGVYYGILLRRQSGSGAAGIFYVFGYIIISGGSQPAVKFVLAAVNSLCVGVQLSVQDRSAHGAFLGFLLDASYVIQRVKLRMFSRNPRYTWVSKKS
jgi:hypothetical protein